MNKSKELSGLFKAYMHRLSEKKNIPFQVNNNYSSNGVCGVIYFYEWSDIHRMPMTYFSKFLFERFLSDCGIALKEWQRALIDSWPKIYITCKPGEKELLLRDSYESLRVSLEYYSRMNAITSSDSSSYTFNFHNINNRLPERIG